MKKNMLWVLAVAVLLLPPVTSADDLMKMVQEDLTALGYEPGEINGEATIPTVVAISKFQSQHDLEVTGEATPQLAGIIKAQISKPKTGATTAPVVASAQATAVPAAEPSATELQIAQQQCLQRKYEKEQEKAKTKRGLGSLMRAVSRTAGQSGNSDVAADIAETSSDIYNVNATAADLESAAKDLGLSKKQVEKCRNPS